MNLEDERIEGAVVEEPEEAPQSSWVLVAQFFIVPVVIVGLCVGIFVLFGLITGETRSARDYLEEVKAGKGNRRWQAAFELSKHVSQMKEGEADPRLAREVTSAFRSTNEDDPRIRQYLALAMGRLHDSVAVEPLIEALDDTAPDTQLYVVWALGELADRKAVDPLLQLLDRADADLRKMIIYSLGVLQDPRAIPRLQGALNDNTADVRWNAALSLARLRHPSGIPTLHEMLDRSYLDRQPEVTERQKTEAIINAARAVALLKDHSARPLLEKIRIEDPDMKARNAAIEALEALP